jgi:hypothetical protein
MGSIRKVVLALLTVTLAGCISLGDLSHELEDTEESVAPIVTMIDQCPKESSERFLDGVYVGIENLDSLSELELGIEIIRVANGRAAALAGADQNMMNFVESLPFRTALWDGELIGLSDSGADLAEKAFSRDVDALVLSPAAQSDSDERIISRSQWKESAEMFAETTARKGWTSSFVRTLGHLFSKQPSQEESQTFKKRLLISAYMIAYFRNGRIFSVDLDQQQLRDDLLSEFEAIIEDQAINDEIATSFNKFFEGFVENACHGETKQECLILGGIGEETFVTRAGKSYSFPGISATISPSADKKISTDMFDEDAVIDHLVRVLGEAVGDSRSDVPGAVNSTLCKIIPARCPEEADLKRLQNVDNAGDRAEAAARYVASMAVRGGWLFALNNEALATSIETALSVAARKTTEAAVWSNGDPGCVQGKSDDRYSKIRYKFVPGTL